MKRLLVLFLIINAKLSFAGCNFKLSAPVINYSTTNTSLPVAYTLSLERTGSNDLACSNFMIGFSKGSANSYTRSAVNSSNGTTILYNLYKTINSSNALKRVDDTNSNSEVVTGTVAKNTTVTADFYFNLVSPTSSTLLRGGTYTDTLTLSAFSGTMTNNNGQEDDATMTVNISVPKVASLSLVDTGGTYDPGSTNKTLDFGELTAGDEKTFDVIVSSNAGYNLSVSSTNNQLLKLTTSTPTLNTQIDYIFYSNGSLKNLSNSSSSPVSLSSGSGVTPIQGTRIPIKVSIGSVTNKDPGTYQDYVTFTIATIE